MHEQMKKVTYHEISQLLGKNLGSEEGGTFLQLWSGSPPILGYCWEGRLCVVKGSGCTGKNSGQWPNVAFFNELSELKYNKISIGQSYYSHSSLNETVGISSWYGWR